MLSFNPNRLLLLLPLFIIILVPTTFTGSFYVNLFGFRVVFVEGVLVFGLQFLLLFRLLLKRQALPKYLKFMILAIFILLFEFCLSLNKSPDIAQGIRLIIETFYMFAYVVTSFLLASKDYKWILDQRLRQIFYAFSIVNFFLIVSGIGFNKYDDSMDYSFFFTIFGKHGAFLCTIIIMYYISKHIHRHKLCKIDIIMIIFNFATLILTGSRTAIFSFFLSFIFILLITKYFKLKTLILSGVISLCGFFLLPYLPIANHYFEDGKINLSWSGRLPFWERVVDVWLQSGNVLFGSGQGFTRSWLLENQFSDIVTIGALHNEMLRILIESGLLGILLYLFIFIYLIFVLLKRLDRTSDNIFVTLGVFCLTQYVIASIPEITTQLYLVYGQFVFLIVGFAFGYDEIKHETSRGVSF